MRFLLAYAFLLLSLPSIALAEDITEADLRAHIEILASDDFGGRKPGTVGENKTVNYIATEWAKAGLVPAGGDQSWYAPVVLVDRTPISQNIEFTYFKGAKQKPLRIKDDQIILRGVMQSGSISNASVVYTGYGNAPPEQLEDTVSGNLALMLLSSPEGQDNFPDYRTRKANLIAAGAWGVITIIDNKNRWDRSARRYREANTDLDRTGQHADLEGIISRSVADKILQKSALGKSDWFAVAQDEAFEPLKTGILADLSAETLVRYYTSHNVIGKIAGSKPDEGAILFMGHWDHFGTCRAEDKADPAKDLICNGAVDNASGISVLIEVAERLHGTKPERDIYFLATTAEESGLLGAKAFVENPGFDLNSLVAVFNADTVALAPDGKLIAIVGRGETPLDADLEKIAEAEGREIDTTDNANAFLRRQDGFAFLEKDIPALMVTSAFANQELLDTYLNEQYHDVTDELNDGLLLGGAADDANFHIALGRYFSSTDTYPAKASGGNYAN